MGETAGALIAEPELRHPDEIRNSIAQTREEMAGTVDAIQEKLRPAHFAAQVKTVAVSKVREVAATTSEKLKAVTARAADASAHGSPLERAGSGARLEAVARLQQARAWTKEHPLPAPLAALVLTMLIMRRVRGGSESEYDCA